MSVAPTCCKALEKAAHKYLFVLQAGFQDGFVTAKLPQGYVRGKTEKTPSGVEYMSFRGIPYAQPPIGDLRFKVRPYVHFPSQPLPLV